MGLNLLGDSVILVNDSCMGTFSLICRNAQSLDLLTFLRVMLA